MEAELPLTFKSKNYEFNLKRKSDFVIYTCRYNKQSFKHKILHVSDPDVPKILILVKRLIVEFEKNLELRDLVTSEVVEVISHENESNESSCYSSKISIIALFITDISLSFRTVCDHKLFSNALFVYSKRIAPKIETANWVHLEENCMIHWQFILQQFYDQIFIQDGFHIAVRSNLNCNIINHVVKEFFRGSQGFSPCGYGEEWRYFKGCKKQRPNYAYSEDIRTLLILEKFNYLLLAELFFIKQKKSNFNVENGIFRIEEAYRKAYYELVNSSMVITEDLESKRANMINFYEVYDPSEIWLEFIMYHSDTNEAECKVIFDKKLPLETRRIHYDLLQNYKIGKMNFRETDDANQIDWDPGSAFDETALLQGRRIFFRPYSYSDLHKRKKMNTPDTCVAKKHKRLCNLS